MTADTLQVVTVIMALTSIGGNLAALAISRRSRLLAATIAATESKPCGPYTCPYPKRKTHQPGDRWTCPGCGTHYRLSRRIPDRPWRRQSAPDGAWRVDVPRQRAAAHAGECGG